MVLIFLLNYPSVFCQVVKSTNQQHYTLKKVVTRYDNGKIKRIETFAKDSCLMCDCEKSRYFHGDEVMVDTCRYGIFKEYYPDGTLKISGQYDCRNYEDPTEDEEIRNSGYFFVDCFRTGTWHEYTPEGDTKKTTIYRNNGYGSVKYYRYATNQDTLIADKDSCIFPLKDYMKINSYLVKRSSKNKYLSFKVLDMQCGGSWRISDAPLNTLTEKKGKFIMGYSRNTSLSEHPDFSSVKDGEYYMCYNPTHKDNFCKYEIQIIIQTMK